MFRLLPQNFWFELSNSTKCTMYVCMIAHDVIVVHLTSLSSTYCTYLRAL